jgi:hypothetical protein
VKQCKFWNHSQAQSLSLSIWRSKVERKFYHGIWLGVNFGGSLAPSKLLCTSIFHEINLLIPQEMARGFTKISTGITQQ